MRKTAFVRCLALVALISLAAMMLGCGPSTDNGTNKPMTSSPTPDPCTSPSSDKAIWEAIYAEMAKDAGLKGQIKHINVMSKQREVSFLGWADSKADKDKVVAIAKATACVLKVTPDGLGEQKPPPGDPGLPKPGGCATGYKPCGDFCIPNGDACNIAADPMDPGGNVNTNTKSNSGTSGGNMNAAGSSNGNRIK